MQLRKVKNKLVFLKSLRLEPSYRRSELASLRWLSQEGILTGQVGRFPLSSHYAIPFFFLVTFLAASVYTSLLLTLFLG